MNLYKKDGGLVTFGNNKKGKIIGKGTIGNDYSCILIQNELLVDGLKHDQVMTFVFSSKILLVDDLKHDLLSISQLCDKCCV